MLLHRRGGDYDPLCLHAVEMEATAGRVEPWASTILGVWAQNSFVASRRSIQHASGLCTNSSLHTGTGGQPVEGSARERMAWARV